MNEFITKTQKRNSLKTSLDRMLDKNSLRTDELMLLTHR